MIDILTVGNALIDAFLSLHDANDHCKLDRQNSLLCVEYGRKLLLDSSSFQIGGNAANVAVGVARLGGKTALMAEIGSDDFADTIITGLKKEGVGLDHVRKGDKPTSFAIGLQFQRERTLFVSHQTRAHTFSFSSVEAKWLYLTSLGNTWEHAYAQAERYITSSSSKLAFNPGSLQIEMGLSSIARILAVTDMLFLSREEASQLLDGHTKNHDLSEIGRRLQETGAKTIVITNGEKGSYVLAETGEEVALGTLESSVIEKTGAGDAYASGFLAAIVAGESLQSAMIWGTLNATSVIGIIGSQPGLLTKSQMEDALREEGALLKTI